MASNRPASRNTPHSLPGASTRLWLLSLLVLYNIASFVTFALSAVTVAGFDRDQLSLALVGAIDTEGVLSSSDPSSTITTFSRLAVIAELNGSGWIFFVFLTFLGLILWITTSFMLYVLVTSLRKLGPYYTQYILRCSGLSVLAFVPFILLG